MGMLSDKDQKKQFKKIASENPDSYYPTNALKRNGYIRKQCVSCSRYFWTPNEPQKKCGDPACNAGFQVVKNNPSQNRLSFVQVWQKIVEILEPRGYKPLKRYPVVARWNPTTEFTIASIAAFQPYVIAGEVPPPAKKLLIPQFCLRFGDIENVGITGSHCTGFVMIGQHQFVSVDEWNQEQAFQDIYDFLIQGVGLDKHEVTIHEDAWAGGGNFGPCMEFFSRGVELFNQVYMMFQQTPEGPVGLKLKVLDMGLGQERVAWFSQGTPNMYEAIFPLVLSRIREKTQIKIDYDLYNRFSQYSAFLNVDEVDNMDEAWARVAKEMQMGDGELKEKIIPMTAIYSIAEHSRALLFAISDGKLPSNVGGGYNLRVIFRRAIGFIDRFGWDIDMGQVCRWHAEELQDIFPEVSENLDEVCRILEVEKQKFYASKTDADKIVKRLIKNQEITEEKLIELYDSNGINPELIREAAAKMGKKVKVPDDFYGKVIARHEIKQQIHETHKAVAIDVEGLPPTTSLYFDDYLTLKNSGKVLRIKEVEHEIEDETVEDADATKKIKAWAVILDQSAAYPTSGGQMHDTGTINGQNFVDVLKVGPCITHMLVEKPKFKEGDSVNLVVDKDRRAQLTHNHSATHIVNAAARELLGSHINQAGAKKTLTKAHLDITHFESLGEEIIDAIEKRANEIVSHSIQSKNRFLGRTEAEQQYGMRLYQGGAVPGTMIRVTEIPGIEVEACGGTHVNNTKEVGTIRLIKSQKIQDGIVRLTFTAGAATEKYDQDQKEFIGKIASILESKEEFIVSRAQELLDKWKELRKAKASGEYSEESMLLTSTIQSTAKPLRELSKIFDSPAELLVGKISKLKEEWEAMKKEIKEVAQIVADENIKSLISKAESIGDVDFIAEAFQGVDNSILSNIVKNILKQKKDAVLFFVGSSEKGANFVASAGPNVKGIDLPKIFKIFLQSFNGKGGGKQELVQGFITDFSGELKDLLVKFKQAVFS
jgi:alanine--tRNA ligase